MTQNDKTTEILEEMNGRNPVIKALRTVLHTAIGTIALGKEEVETLVNRLIEKGEIAEKDGRELIVDLFDRRKGDVAKAEDKVESLMDQRVESILNRMNVPTKSDVESLSRKISTLSKKVEDLNKKISA